jgi:hypothetical protein
MSVGRSTESLIGSELAGYRIEALQPQDSSLRDGSRKRRGRAGEHLPGSEDVYEELGRARLHRRREHALERPDECLCCCGGTVREAGVLPDRERVRPPVLGDRRVVLRQLRRQLQTGREWRVRITQECATGRADRRPSRP